MDTFTFIPENQAKNTAVPFYEDARASHAPYYASNLTVARAKTEVIEELIKLGAGVLKFQDGRFEGSGKIRYGYLIHFEYCEAAGIIRVAGLPIRKETEAKIVRVKVQALLNVRDWLKTSLTQSVFNPGASPLLPHLLVDARRTLADAIQTNGFAAIPAQINASVDELVVDGEFIES